MPTQWGGYTSVGSPATSSASGAFAVRGLPAGTYRLMITPPYGSELLSAWIGGGDFASATQYPVALGESAVGANAELAKGGVVSGTIVGDGVGIANASVSAYRIASNSSQEWLDGTTTNFDGEFTFSRRMPAGEIRLYASLNTYTYGQSPYLSTWYDGKQSFVDATPIAVVAGETTSVEFPMIKGASVTGQVLAGDPALPVPDATVDVCRDGFWNCRSVTTDDEGRYSAIGLEAGQYVVRALPPAGSNLLTAYFGGTDQNSASKLTLALGQTAADTTMTLPLGAEIGGRALDTEGDPVAGASVTAYRTSTSGTSWDSSIPATTLADGSYVFHALVPGKYRIRVVPTSSSPLAPGWFGGGATWNSAAEIIAAAGDELSGKDVILTPGAMLSGRVLGGPDEGIEDATVTVHVATQNGSEQLKSAVTGADGSYTIRGLGAGTYRIQVTTDPSSPWMSTWLGGDSFWNATPISIDGADVVADITVLRGGIISGTLTEAASGDAVPNVTVQACRMYDYSDAENYCGYSTSVSTDANGHYRFTRLVPGTYKVAVGANGFASGPWIETWYGGEDIVTATRLGVAYGSEYPDVDLALVAGGSISGTVKAGDPATAVSYAYVTTYRVSGSGFVYVKQSYVSNGIFSITGLTPGEYVLQASGSSPWVATWYGGSSQSTATRVTVVGDEDTSGIGIVLNRGATLLGSVVNAEDGQGIGGAYVHLCRAVDDGYYYDEDDCSYVSSVSTGSDGSYQFTSVQPGEYRLRAFTTSGSQWLPGWYGGGTGSVLTVAEASDTADADIVLTRGARISGTITGAGASGQPSVPVEDAYATLYRTSDDYAITSDVTDASGAYVFSQLEAGTYHLAVRPPSASPWMREWMQDAATRVGATAIVVTAGQALTGQDVALARGGMIEGAVTGDGQPVPHVTVGIYDAATGDRVTSVTTGVDGRYAAGGLDAGEYHVKFDPSDRSGNWLGKWHADRATKLTADPVEVQVGQVSTVDAQLAAGGQIRGTVVGLGDVGLDDVGIAIYAAGSGEYIASSSTNASGEYVVSGLPSGTYKVAANSYRDDGYSSQWFSGRATQELADSIAVAVGQEEVADFTLAPGGSISGTVSGPQGPVVGTSVTACSEDDCRSDSTSADGSYRIVGLVEGNYTVRFGSWSGTLAQEWYDDAPVEAEADLVAVTSGASIEGIDAALVERGRLIGKMADESGVGVWGQVRACSVGTDAGGDCYWASSTPLGNWAMGLPAGQYRVQFSATGFATKWFPNAADEAGAELVMVTPASEQRLDAELVAQSLPEGGSVTVTVTGDSGSGVAPVADAQVDLIPVGSDEPEASRWTGQSGVASFASVPPGSYVVSVQPRNEWIPRYLGGDGSLAQATPIDVVAGGVVDAGTVEVARAASISGTITSGGQPVDYVTVLAQDLTGDWVASGYTNYRGEYRIPGLVAGQYNVFVDASNAPGNLASRWVDGGSDPSSAQAIAVAAGQQVTGTDVELVGASRIAGTVTAASGGALLRSILVELYSVDAEGGELIDIDRTDSEGGFSFGHLSAGEFKVRAGGLELSCDPGIVGCTAPLPSPEAPVWQPLWFDQAETYASATLVPLAAGQRVLDVDIALAAAETGVRVSIAGPSLATAGTAFVLSGTTTNRPGDGVVVVQSKAGDVWSDVATAAVTGQSWLASVVAPGAGTVTYRAVMRQGTTDLAVSVEKVVTVVPAATVPGRPGTPTLVGLGDGQVSVAWTAAAAGGSATTGYTVTAAPGGASCTTAAQSCTVTGLTNGTAYTFSAVATNSYGNGPASTPSAPFTPRTVPGAPAQPLAVAGTDGRVTVHWAAPTTTGGATISGYTATADPGGLSCTTTGALSCVVVGLTNGTPYTFTMRASNVAGAGPASPASVPVSPQPAVVGAGSVGGAVRIDGSLAGVDAVWISIWNSAHSAVTSTDSSGSYAFQGLAPGTYSLQASPLEPGISGFTGQVDVVQGQNTLKDVALVTIPDAVAPPASVTLTDLAGQDLPVDSDDIPRVGPTVSTILFEVKACADATVNYTAEDWYDGATSGTMAQTAAGSGRYAADVDISGLSGEVHFTATIVCPNPAVSPPEVEFDIYIDPSGIVVDQDGQPIEGATTTLVRSDSADGPFTVVPDGSEIMSPRNRVNPGTTGADGAFSWDVIAGYYQVRVTADGCDPGSTEVLEIPPVRLGLVVALRCGLPGKPGAPTATAGNRSAVVSWTAPDDAGAAVTGYTVTASPGGRSCTTTALTCTIDGLANGTSYTFVVVANSGVGSGPASDPSNAVTPTGLPAAPGALTATPGDGRVALSWAAPADTGGLPITGYRVTVTPGSVVESTGTAVTVTGLANGTAYSFTVAAVNARGVGPASGAVGATPTAPAPPPPPPPPPGPPPVPPAPEKMPTSMALTASPTKGTLTTAITLQAAGLPGNATGTVTFEDLGHVVGVVPVANGSARITTKEIFGGTQSITATYSGDATYKDSRATAVVRITDKVRPSITAPKANKSASSPTITFRAKDAGGVRLVMIRYRMSAPGRTKLGKWISAGSVPGTAQSWQKAGGFTPATKVCYQVKALDYAGRSSASKSKCTTVR